MTAIARGEHQELWNMVRAAGHDGNRLDVFPFPDGGLVLRSNWENGSRNVWVFRSLIDGKSVQAPGTGFMQEAEKLADLPEGIALICIRQGCFTGASIYLHPNNISKNLPAAATIDDHTAIVVSYTRRYKSSYAGISDYRKHIAVKEDAVITAEAWDAAKTVAIAEGFLDKRGAITAKGKNAVEHILDPRFHFRKAS